MDDDQLDALDELQARTFATATAATRASYPEGRRLSGAALRGYLDRRVFATASTTRADGRPHAAPTSYVRRGTTFWLPTATATVRARNVDAQPWLVLVVAEGDRAEHVAVIIEGPCAAVATHDVPADVLEFAGEWATRWLRLEAQRLLSYAAEGAIGPDGSSTSTLA